MNKMKRVLMVALIALVGISMFACVGEEDVIKIGEGTWASNAFHDQIAKIIIEEGYGEEVQVMSMDTSMMIASLKEGDIDLSMETWSGNIPTYEQDIEDGEYIKLSTNFDDNVQGIYIPSYLQEEYPELTHVKDLLNDEILRATYDGDPLFWSDEQDSRVIYGGPEGWEATKTLHKKMEAYGLDEEYIFKTFPSTATLNTTLKGAYDEEAPWVGYNWEPTAIMGMYDMVLLEDDEYTPELYEQGKSAFPTNDVNIVVNTTFQDTYPGITDFLSNYETSSALTNEGLAYMEDNDAEPSEAAVWFLLENEDLWSGWVTTDAYDSIMSYLNSQ